MKKYYRDALGKFHKYSAEDPREGYWGTMINLITRSVPVDVPIVHWGVAGGTIAEGLKLAGFNKQYGVDPVAFDVPFLERLEPSTALYMLQACHVFDAYHGDQEQAHKEREYLDQNNAAIFRHVFNRWANTHEFQVSLGVRRFEVAHI